MTQDGSTGEQFAIPEDTLDLGMRLDPVRTLLRRAGRGDDEAAGTLVDLLGPRVYGLALHVTGSSTRSVRLTVSVLRSCLRDAAALSAGALPGEAAVMDRARRAAVATRPTGDVLSLVAPRGAEERTRDRREMAVVRTLLGLPPHDRADVESAAQGRFPFTGAERRDRAELLAGVLDRLSPIGEPGITEVRALAALDALALADGPERERLRVLTADGEGAAVHRHAVEAAAQLTLLTAVQPSRDLHPLVLGEGAEPVRGTAPAGAASAGSPGTPASPGTPPTPGSPTDLPDPAETPDPPEPPAGAAGSSATPAVPAGEYHGTYATPVLGSEEHRRMVGPPVRTGTLADAEGPAPAGQDAPAAPAEGTAEPSPAFAFRPEDERRRDRRRPRAATGERGRPARLLGGAAVLALLLAVVAGGLALDARRDRAAATAFTREWTELATDELAVTAAGVSDNGTWRATSSAEGTALWAEGVVPYDGEVLQVWGETADGIVDLGVLELEGGAVRHRSDVPVQGLRITREHSPGTASGSPSERVVATVDLQG